MLSINKIDGILLAGGSSNRLGKPKQLIIWHGKFLINHMIDTIHNGGVDNLHVVLGYCFDDIRQIIQDKTINIINNVNWKSGMSSSINAGITSLEKDVMGVFIFVVDQPFLNEVLIRKMVAIFKVGEAEIVAPRVNFRQCNPVLFHKKAFKDLLLIHGDKGGKMLLSKRCTHWVDWDDERLLLDIDTTQDYLFAVRNSG